MLHAGFVRALLYALRPMNPHCFLTGHDVDVNGLSLDRCVHCQAALPVRRLRVAFEASLRGLLLIAFVVAVPLARLVMRPHASLEVVREDQAPQDR